ncbi:MAG: transcriptional regulator ArgP [Spirochaetes bacterium RIFOXYC1_FULL_54_7]|nr:MAG: transcriptional regulator ArgP [Spirochaetes bacterium RIFOXYC1_FULL_54_7]
MIDYRLLEAFAAVLDEGGFDRAATRLGITQSAVSQRIRALEDGMGRILILRETPPRATMAGERLLRHFRQVAGLEDEAIADLGISEETEFRHLPIAVNADSLSVWFLEAISPFLADSKVTLEIFVDDQDKTTRFLRAGTVVGCIASDRMDVQGFTSTKIGVLRYLLVVSPDFSKRWFPEGFDRASATRAPVIHFNRDDQLQYRALSRIFGMPQVLPPAHYIPSAEKLADAVLRGLGYAMMPEIQAIEEIKAGRLIELDRQGRLETPLFWYRWNRPSELLERFTRTILTEGKRILDNQYIL